MVYGIWQEGSWERNSKSLLGKELSRLEGKCPREILAGTNWPWTQAGASRFLGTMLVRSGMSFAGGVWEAESKTCFQIVWLHFRKGTLGCICPWWQNWTWPGRSFLCALVLWLTLNWNTTLCCSSLCHAWSASIRCFLCNPPPFLPSILS